MAGEDWIRMRVNISRDPKVVVIAAALAKSRRFMAWALEGDARGRRTTLSTGAVAGIAVNGLLQVWGTARTQGESSGDDLLLPNLTLEMLDVIAGVPDLGAAMSVVQWALKTPDGGVVLPKFFLQNASAEELRKRRAAARQKRKRERERDARRDSERDSHAESHGTDHAGVTPESRPEEEVEEEYSSCGAAPPPAEEGSAPPVPSKPKRPKKPKAPPKPREPNPLFDAVAEVTGSDPALTGSLIGMVTAALASAEPPYTPAEVREFGRRFHDLCAWAKRDNRARPTPPELQRHIGLLRAGKPKAAPPRPAGTAVDFEADMARRAPPLAALPLDPVAAARAAVHPGDQ